MVVVQDVADAQGAVPARDGPLEAHDGAGAAHGVGKGREGLYIAPTRSLADEELGTGITTLAAAVPRIPERRVPTTWRVALIVSRGEGAARVAWLRWLREEEGGENTDRYCFESPRSNSGTMLR